MKHSVFAKIATLALALVLILSLAACGKKSDSGVKILVPNEQGKILPRRLTGTSQKFQKKVAQAVKRARHLAILPFVTDCMK